MKDEPIGDGELASEFLAMRSRALQRGVVAKYNLLNRLGGCITAEEMAAKLGVTLAELDGYRSQGQILAAKVEGYYRYPVWQVDDSGNILLGIDEVLAVLVASPACNSMLTVLSFFVQDNRYLEVNLGGDMLVPALALCRGNVDVVRKAATVFLTHGAV
jgi:hypothetical protein